ncbi:MAG: gamma-glutamyltransferase family protein [Candidatus Lokiarchaeota archaeon]|nr:gamma-glutamyltransferase family protein [Candidatus Lokiarchaeota archaeon]
MPILAKNIVSTSHPLACQAGLSMIRKGGNAVDAAIATAITLAVVEPVNNGIGSDAFAIVFDGKKLTGLNASGKSPAAWTPDHFAKYTTMPLLGWDSVTIPGAVSAWVALSKKYGQLKFKELFEPAIYYAENGFLVSPITATLWKQLAVMYKKDKFPAFHETFLPTGGAPKPGELFKNLNQAATLTEIANTDGESFYAGELAKKIVNHAKDTGGLISREDLENHQVMWENLLTMEYNGVTLHELPPNGQGVTALVMLGILKNFDLDQFECDSPQSMHLQIEAMKLAFSDAYRYISDKTFLEFDPSLILSPDYLADRANLIDQQKAQRFNFGNPPTGDTVYLTTADAEGMMVSYIQSNYLGFGSGIVIPGTGISLQDRGNGFNLIEGHPNQVGPEKRPYHTIIPAFVTKNGEPLMSFGVMGGAMQPQGHAQMMVRIFEYNQNPQAALDAPRWRVMEGLQVNLEPSFNKEAQDQLKRMGHQVYRGHYFEFGGGQIIYRLKDGYLAASDPRKDGQAVGY